MGNFFFESFNHISFVTWAVTRNANFQVFIIGLDHQNIELLDFICPLLFTNWAENQNYEPRSWGTTKKTEHCPSQTAKYQRCSALNQCRFKENQQCVALIWALKIFVSSAVDCWFSAVQSLSGCGQRYIRTETVLNQSWSALSVFERFTQAGLEKHNYHSIINLWLRRKSKPWYWFGVYVSQHVHYDSCHGHSMIAIFSLFIL